MDFQLNEEISVLLRKNKPKNYLFFYYSRSELLKRPAGYKYQSSHLRLFKKSIFKLTKKRCQFSFLIPLGRAFSCH